MAKADWCKLKMINIFPIFANFATRKRTPEYTVEFYLIFLHVLDNLAIEE